MTLKPEEILEYEFSRAFRGYSEGEVNEFLEEMANQWEDLLRDNERLQRECDDLKKQISESRQYAAKLELSLEEWKKQGEIEKEMARRESQMMLKEAELKSRQIVEEAMSQRKEIEAGYSEIKDRYNAFILRFKSLLQTFLQSVEWKEKELKEESRHSNDALSPSQSQERDSIENKGTSSRDEVARFSVDDFRNEGSAES